VWSLLRNTWERSNLPRAGALRNSPLLAIFAPGRALRKCSNSRGQRRCFGRTSAVTEARPSGSPDTQSVPVVQWIERWPVSRPPSRKHSLCKRRCEQDFANDGADQPQRRMAGLLHSGPAARIAAATHRAGSRRGGGHRQTLRPPRGRRLDISADGKRLLVCNSGNRVIVVLKKKR